MLDNVYFSVPLPPSQDSRQQQQPPLQKQQQQQNHALPFQNQLLSTSFFGNHASCLDSISSSVLHHHHHHQQNLLFLAPPLTTSTTHNPSGAHHQQQITAAAALAAAASSHLDNQNGTNKISTPTTNQLDHQNNSNNGSSRRLKPPRAPALKKDRHTKIYTAKGLRDRRVRLSMNIARNFFDLQDILGFDKASKTLEWLFSKSKRAIDEIAREYNNSYNDGDKGRLTAQLGARNSTSSFMLPSGRDHRKIDQEVAMPDKEKTRSGRSSSYNRVVVDSVVARERRAKARERARERTKEMKINKELLLQQHNDNDHGHHHHHHHHHEHEHDDQHAMNHYLINNNNNNNNNNNHNNSRSSLINGISDIDQFEDQGSCSSGTHQLQQQQLLWNSNPGLNESIVIKTKPKLAVNYSTTSSSTTDRIDHHHHQSFVPISPLGTKGAIASSSLSALSHVINLSNRGQKPLEICGYQILR